MSTAWRRRESFWNSIVLLLGHLAATALVFVSLFTLGWAVSCALEFLNALHPFPPTIYLLVTRLEVGSVYLDAGVSGIVLLAGIFQFVRDLLER